MNSLQSRGYTTPGELGSFNITVGVPATNHDQLMAIAEYVDKTLAICVQCGNPANHTQRLVPSGDRVLVGATGLYEARCRRCFDPLLAGPPSRSREDSRELPTPKSQRPTSKKGRDAGV